MPKAPRPWIVTPHKPIEKLDDNLWVVEGNVPGVPFRRRMSIIKRTDGTLMFFNAMPLEDAALAEVTTWGKPSILVVPHDQHMIDAHAFAERLGLKIYGPKECETKTRARADMSGTFDDIPADPTIRVERVAGVKLGEPAILVTSTSGRASLLVSDVIMNNQAASIGFLPRLLGFAGGVKIAPVFRLMFLKDKAALKQQIHGWATIPQLARLVPCHGDVVATSVPEVLRSVAATL